MAARLAEARVERVADFPLRNAVADPVTPTILPTAEVAPASKMEPELEERKAPEAAAVPQMAAPVEMPVFDAPELRAPVVAETEDFSEQAQHVSPLMSESAGAQVARSFDELAAMVDSGPRRSLDELAQEMLRPMLQEWLDDNLPTLVERLVREEIERVARGPRR